MFARLRGWLVPTTGDFDPQHVMARMVWTGIAVILVGVVGLGGWAMYAPLSGAVIAQGFVKVDMNRKVVQHQEGGIVKEILVRDGDSVRQGQVLMVIQDVRVDASLDLLRNQLDAEHAKAARLEAERVFRPAPDFTRELVKRAASEPKLAEILNRERTLFTARRQALESQIGELRKQIRETEQEIAALTEQIAAESRALRLQRDELAANQELVKQGYVQKTRILTLERAVAEYEARHGEHRAELSKTRQRSSELELRILSMRNQYAQGAADELKEASARIFDLEERIRPSRDAAARQKITAPIAGEVVGLRVFTAGSVVGPREVLMEIVPEEKTLVVEARIRPEDINYVHKGTEADIRLTAYKQRTTPLVKGAVSYVSGDRMVDQQTGHAYYVVQIEVTTGGLGELKMQAGMPAEVFIRTDSRTAFDYLLAPVTDYLRRAMREPV
jgi:epimerase transport system membrane fusion protein